MTIAEQWPGTTLRVYRIRPSQIADLRSLAKNAEELLEVFPPCGKFPARAD